MVLRDMISPSDTCTAAPTPLLLWCCKRPEAKGGGRRQKNGGNMEVSYPGTRGMVAAKQCTRVSINAHTAGVAALMLTRHAIFRDVALAAGACASTSTATAAAVAATTRAADARTGFCIALGRGGGLWHSVRQLFYFDNFEGVIGNSSFKINLQLYPSRSVKR